MVKTPKTRHSKTHREPVTIELEPGAVSRVEDAAKAEAVAEAGSVSATMGDEAVAEPAASEPKAPADTDFASYSYDFDNGQQPKAEAPASAAASDAGSSYASSSAASTSTPVRQSTSGILPGLAGGLIALLVAGGLQYAGVLGTPGNAGSNGDEQLQAEIASLKSQVADIGASSGGGELKGQVDGISAAVQEVKSEIEALKTAAGQAGSGEALAGLDGRIKQIEAAVATLGQNGAASTEIAALNERLAGLDAAVKSAGEAATADDGKIATLEQSVSTLASKVEAQASQPKIALAIAASALKAAVDRGGAFGAELETFAAISPDAPELATLRAHAEKGVATRADIVAETDAAANAMIAAAKPVNPDAGVFERLVSSAEQLVKVRPIGAVEGAGAPETVARMELAVSQGDFAKAIAEYETLPDAAKAAGADFAAKLKARLEVETLIDQLVANAMKA